jgi:hypothetical protein
LEEYGDFDANPAVRPRETLISNDTHALIRRLLFCTSATLNACRNSLP